MTDFGELALLVGDLHIPFRAKQVPSKIKAVLQPNKVQHVICTGNVSSPQQLTWLKSLSKDFHIVRGQCQDGFNPQAQHWTNTWTSNYPLGQLASLIQQSQINASRYSCNWTYTSTVIQGI